MTTLENSMTFVSSIKGAPVSVLLALLMTRRPMTNQELQRWTGYDHDAITTAIGTLLDLGWLSATSDCGPWFVVAGRQLLPGFQPQLDDASHRCDLTAAPEQSADDLQTPGPSDEDREDSRFVANLHAFYDAGIREPTAGRLARLPHITPEYIAAHVDVANAQGFRLGTAIHRIQHAWPIPHPKPILSVDDKINRFKSEQWRSKGPPVWDDESPDRPADPPFDPENYHD